MPCWSHSNRFWQFCNWPRVWCRWALQFRLVGYGWVGFIRSTTATVVSWRRYRFFRFWRFQTSLVVKHKVWPVVDINANVIEFISNDLQATMDERNFRAFWKKSVSCAGWQQNWPPVESRSCLFDVRRGPNGGQPDWCVLHWVDAILLDGRAPTSVSSSVIGTRTVTSSSSKRKFLNFCNQHTNIHFRAFWSGCWPCHRWTCQPTCSWKSTIRCTTCSFLLTIPN